MKTLLKASELPLIAPIRHFLSNSQMQALADGILGPEREFFIEKCNELKGVIENMPHPYSTDGQGDDAVIHLHYFVGGFDWWIIERDSSDEQHQAFGIADMFEVEFGYISIAEIIENGCELDFFWKPITVGELRKEKGF